LIPLGYSNDGRTIYAAKGPGGQFRELFQVPADGGTPSRLAALPFDQPADEIELVPGTRSFLCAITETDSDIWFVENFDPDAAAR
jgi:hypothetical protein